VAWREDLSVGDELLDRHHKRLFQLLGDIDHVLDHSAGYETLTKVLAELNDYIAYHFREEEAMMERSAFPFIALHRHSHQTIALRVADMCAAVTETDYMATARELRAFLSGWLVHHIEIEDFEYRPFINRN
jgi:hemerythrin